MRLQDLTNSKAGVQVGIWLGQHMPRWFGYALARFAATLIAACKPGIYRTVRTNLRHVLGERAEEQTLDELTRNVFYHAGQTYYDFFRSLNLSSKDLAQTVKLPQDFERSIRSKMEGGQGVLILFPHMSNFDLAGLALAARGLSSQALSLADPEAGFNVLNRLRTLGGQEATPINTGSLRAAIRRLQQGGLVATGMDRPDPTQPERPLFFGKPSYLPVGPARLAMMSKAVVFVASCRYDPREGYYIAASEPVEMTRSEDRERDTLANAHRLASLLEEHVRAQPDQWLMFHPVWPGKETFV